MPQPNDLSRSLVALDQNSTIIVVIEMSQSSWLVGGVLPGIERQPRKKLEPSPERLLALLHRWRDEAVRAGRTITRIAVAFEAGLPALPAQRIPHRGLPARLSTRPHERQPQQLAQRGLITMGTLWRAARCAGGCRLVFVDDSPLEGRRFEPSVPAR